MRRLLILLGAFALAWPAVGASTITATNRFAWSANLGWIDWRGDLTNGASIGEYVCSGYLYSANAGWIQLGNGSPTNGIQYQNLAGNDYGVNHDGQGNLRGYAYGANIGWIHFENAGAPKVDLISGRFTGFAYSANCGWISLSNAAAVVQTATITPGVDDDDDGLADAWERTHFNNLSAAAQVDSDNDGASNLQEYLAGSNPLDATDHLVITAQSFANDGTLAQLTWKSALTRSYTIEKTLNLTTTNWFDSGLGLIAPDGVSTTREFSDTNAPSRFYRVRSLRPLFP